ncbi:MAG: sensor histidine kinase, partial [Aggregatilineales bacterium]
MIHTSPGGIIQLGACQRDGNAIITVKDNGAGIAETELPYIFENFYQTDATLASDTSSNGMGLSISQKIIQLHDGTMKVSSIPGIETTFEVILPVAKAKENSVPAFVFQQ